MSSAPTRRSHLWSLASRQWIDPSDLPPAIEQQIRDRDLDFRSNAADPRRRCGAARGLGGNPTRPRSSAQMASSSSGERKTWISSIRSPLKTIDELAEQGVLGADLKLQLAHFQSHYLPDGWESRLSSLGRFGKLDVSLVDTYDIAASKLLSPRAKDRDDLRALLPHLDKATLASRLQSNCNRLLAEPDLRKNAELNWYVVYGEPLPVSDSPPDGNAKTPAGG